MKKTILVVEDERSLQAAIKAKLETNDFAVLTARTVARALEQLEEHKTVHAIWLDHYLLGGENGLEFVTALKSNDSGWKKFPVFVVSNTASDDKVSSYIQLGVEKYFTKSNFRLEDIIKEIKNV